MVVKVAEGTRRGEARVFRAGRSSLLYPENPLAPFTRRYTQCRGVSIDVVKTQNQQRDPADCNRAHQEPAVLGNSEKQIQCRKPEKC